MPVLAPIADDHPTHACALCGRPTVGTLLEAAIVDPLTREEMTPLVMLHYRRYLRGGTALCASCEPAVGYLPSVTPDEPADEDWWLANA